MKSTLNKLFFQAWISRRTHWLFWPTILLALEFLIYVFFFSNTGMIAYHLEQKKLGQINEQISKLEAQKSSLSDQMGILSDDKKALEKFARDFFLYPGQVEIIKFLTSGPDDDALEEKTWTLRTYRTWFFSISFLILIAMTLFFYSNRTHEEEYE